MQELYTSHSLADRGVTDFDRFHEIYLRENERLWKKYRNGHIKVDELRWKRFGLALLEFQIGDETLARQLADSFLALLPTRTELFPGTREVLDYLHQKKYALHLITNGFEQTQLSKLKCSGIAHYFGEVITSERSNSLKPHKDIFEFAFQQTKALPGESIMIGDDWEVDIQGAINAGIDQVYMNHRKITPPLTPTYTIFSLQELTQIF